MDVAHMRDGLHNNFSLLRLVLATMVVFGHFKTLPGLSSAHGLYGFADFSVDAFFVVSGFLIAGSWDKQPSFGSFYIRRFFRIYPLYAAVVLIQAIAMMAAFGPEAGQHITGFFKYLGANLVFANFLSYDIDHHLGPLHNPGINPSLWTLKIEVGFYLILPFLWMLTKRFGLGFLVLVYALSTAYTLVALDHGKIELARQLPGQLRFFVMGIAFYRYRDRLHFSQFTASALTGAMLLVCTYRFEVPMLAVYPLFVGTFVYLFACQLPAVPLRFDISYGVYLFHAPLIQFALLLGWFQDRFLFALGLVAVVYALAFLSEKII